MLGALFAVSPEWSAQFLLVLARISAALVVMPMFGAKGVPAQAKFGERVPIPVTTFSPIATGGVAQQPITSFEYKNVGVNIDITPRTHHDDDVTLALKVAEATGRYAVGAATLGAVRSQYQRQGVAIALQQQAFHGIAAGVAVGALGAGGPLHGGAGAEGPVRRRRLHQEAGEVGRGARTVGAVHDGDRLARHVERGAGRRIHRPVREGHGRTGPHRRPRLRDRLSLRQRRSRSPSSSPSSRR